jgi:hypothetical protein
MKNFNFKNRKFYLFINLLPAFIFFYPNFLIGKVNSKEGNILNTKCPSLTIKKITYITFDKIDKSKLINLNNIECSEIVMIDKLESSKVNITTGRKGGKSVSCLSDTKSNPCKFILGEFEKNIVPNVALKRIFNYEEPKPDFLNETTSRLFINIYNIFEKKYKNISSSLIQLNKDFDY